MSRLATTVTLAVLAAALAALLPLAQAAEKSAPGSATAINSGVSAIPTVGGGTVQAGPGDWPQWRGPNRDGISMETGLMKEWPADGPPLLWKIKGLGQGFSGASVAAGRVYIMGTRSNNDYVFCFDEATQKEAWATKLGPSTLDGPRCNPTVDGTRVFALTPAGDLAGLDTATGKILWHKNMHTDFHGRLQGDYAYCESPLVDGDKLIATPGGCNDCMIVALNKETGEVIWKFAMPDIGSYGHNGAGYSSPVVSEGGGVRQYVQLMGPGLVGVRASDGKFLWGYGRIAQAHSNIPTPVVRGDYVFCSNAYEAGTCLLKLRPNPNEKNGVSAEEVYFLGPDKFENTCGQMVVVGDYVYSTHGTRGGIPICVDFLTGKIMWRVEHQPASGVAGVVYADGNIIYRYEVDSTVCLVAADPTAFRVISQFKSGGGGRSIPVVANGKLFLRAGDELSCYDLKKH